MIVFINCYEEMAVGMRILAAMARELGEAVHLVVLHGYRAIDTEQLSPDRSDTHVLINGRLHINADSAEPITEREKDLYMTRLHELGPSMLCFSARSKNDGIMADLIGLARAAFPDIAILCGGHGPTNAVGHYLRSGANAVVRGEGETPFAEIVKRIQAGKPFLDVPGVSWLSQGKLRSNPLAPPLKDFSRLPGPLTGDEHVTFIENNRLFFRDPAYDNKELCILAGRGCIADCTYCAAPVQRKLYQEEGLIIPRYRRLPDEHVLVQLEKAKQHGILRILFKDEYFTGNTENLVSFFEKYKKRIGLPFKVNLHHEQLLRSSALLETILAAGLRSFALGFQGGNETLTRAEYNRKHRFADMTALAERLFHEFVLLQYHFISGTTLNTEEEFAAKLDLVQRLPFDPIHPQRTMLFDFQFVPQPGSSMSHRIESGAIKRQDSVRWMTGAMLCQIRRVTQDEEFRAVMAQNKTSYTELKDIYDACLRKAKQRFYVQLAEGLAGRDCLLITDNDDSCFPSFLYGARMLAKINMYTPSAQADISMTFEKCGGVHPPILLATRNNIVSGKRLRWIFSLTNQIIPIEKSLCSQ